MRSRGERLLSADDVLPQYAAGQIALGTGAGAPVRYAVQEFLLLALWRIRGARADGGAGLASGNSACMLLDYRQDGEYDRSSRQDIRASSLLKVE
jgi:hypothetical protein